MSIPPPRSGPRPGGRAARVQTAVHAATRELLAERRRDELTVPLIAARAGVTPSTIYRRWGDIAELLADVALERLRPDSEPPDTGSLAGDLRAWGEQYLDEMSSPVGIAMIRDVLASESAPDGVTIPCRCAEFTAAQIEVMLARARQRADNQVPTVDTLMDGVIAPLIYRVLFGPVPPDTDWLYARLAGALNA